MKIGDRVRVNENGYKFIYNRYEKMAKQMKAQHWFSHAYENRRYPDVNTVGVIQCIKEHPNYSEIELALVRLTYNNTNCEFIIDVKGLELV